MTHYEIVLKLIGNVRPEGDPSIDELASKNLKEMCDLTRNLLEEIDMVLCQRPFAKEYSVKKVQQEALDFLREVGYRKK